jgi:hypothetical protein
MSRSRFHPQFQRLLDAFEKDAQTFLLQWEDAKGRAQSSARPVTIDESLKLNAAVKRADDGYAAYTVTAGAVAAIFDLTHTLGATERFVPEIATRGKAMDTRTFRDPTHFLDYTELMGARGEPLPLIPLRAIFNDPVRDLIGLLVFDLALKFLMTHEQMHFVRGHLHYLFGATSPQAYDEVPTGPRSAADSLDLRALEIDADASALWFHLDLYDNNRHLLYLNSLFALKSDSAANVISLFGDQWGWARIVGLSALTVMMLLSLSARSPHSHPSMQTRMLNLVEIYELYLRRKTDYGTRSAPHPSTLRFFSDIATVAHTLQVPPPDPQVLIEWKNVEPDNFQNPACVELRDLQRRFNQLLPKLR